MEITLTVGSSIRAAGFSAAKAHAAHATYLDYDRAAAATPRSIVLPPGASSYFFSPATTYAQSDSMSSGFSSPPHGGMLFLPLVTELTKRPC